MSALAAALYAGLAAIAALFQLALAAGAPWGHLVLGAVHPGRLPARMRALAVFQAALWGALAWAVLARAGLAGAAPGLGFGLAVALTALSFLASLLSPARAERRLWAPVMGTMLGAAIVVSLG